MKLHLPSALRKAVLACLAAFSLPVALPTTLGTASGIVAAGLISAQQVMAEDVLITSKRNANSYNDALGSKNEAGNKWIFDVPSGIDFNFGVDGNKSPTHLADFEFRQTLTVNNGFDGATVTFNEAFTGGAGADLVFVSWGNNVDNTWLFSGDLSQFQGSIKCTTTGSVKPNVTAGVLNVEFAEGAKSNTGAIKQEESGTLNLTIHGQSMSNSEISVNNFTVNGGSFAADSRVSVAGAMTLSGTVNYGANSRVTVGGAMTLNGGVTLAAGAQVTVDGAVTFGDSAALTIYDGGSLTALGSGITLPEGGTINLVTEDEGFDDPFWFFAGGIQGLDEETLARVTLNGSPVGDLAEGKKLAVSGNGLVLVDSDQPGGGTTGTFGPQEVTWGEPTERTEETVELGTTVGNYNYKIANSAKVTGGAEGMNLRLQKTSTGGDSYGGCHLAGGDNETEGAALTLNNLYLTADPNDIQGDGTGDGNKQLYFDIKRAGYLRGVQNVWVNNVGLIIQADMTNLTTNFHLGANGHAKTGGWFIDAKYRKFTLCLQGDLTTSGTLDVVENARIVFDQAHTLTVGSLTGGGDLSLSVVGESLAILEINGDSSSYTGHIIFAQSGNANTTVKLKTDVTLSTSGISVSGDHPGGRFEVLDGTGTARVRVTGTNPGAVEHVVFGEGVTLELAENSIQCFGVGSQIDALTGKGALGVQGGDGAAATVTVGSLDEYEGEVHLFGNGTGRHAVLQLGDAVSTGGELGKVVLRKGGGSLRFGQGEWTLKALDVAVAPDSEVGASELSIGVVDGANKVKLRFDGSELKGYVRLTLSGGIDYSGAIVVDASGGEPEKRWFEVENADVLKNTDLRLQLKLSEEDLADPMSWGGVQLFGSGLTGNMKDALAGIIELAEGKLEDWQRWNISDEGRLTVSRERATLNWEGGEWQNQGEAQWEIEGETSRTYFFLDGDSVNFDGEKVTPPEGGVTVVGTVQPNEMTVKSGEWSFTGQQEGEDGRPAVVEATSLHVEAGASAAVEGALDLRTERATVDGELRLRGTGHLSLGAAEVGATGAIYLESEGALTAGNWDTRTEDGEDIGTNIGGDGKVVLGQDAAVNGGNNLFAALFAGGEAGVERDAKHVGIGTFEVANGVTLTLEGGAAIGKGLSLVRDMRVDEGGELVVQDGVFDSDSSGYAQTGTITLAGSGKAAGSGGALVFDVLGGTAVTWNVALGGDAVVNVGERAEEVSFTGGAELDAAGHTLTFAKGTYRFGGNGSGFYAAGGSSGRLVLAKDVSLTINTGLPADYSGYDVELSGDGAYFSIQSEATFNNVSGEGRVDVDSGSMLILVGRTWGTAKGGAPDVVLRSGADLIIRGNGGGETSKITSLTLNDGNAAMELTLGKNTVNGVLEIGQMLNASNAHTLTLTPNGIHSYIDAHRNDVGWDWTIQLFTGGATGSLHDMAEAGKLQLGGVIGYDWELDETGKLHLTEKTEVYTWTDTQHGGIHQLTWRNGAVAGETGKWDGEVGSYTNGVTAELVGDTGEAVTVTVSGVVEVKEVRISGTSAFTFNKQSDGGSLHAVDVGVGADSTFNPEVTLERRMTVQAGKTATFTGGLVTAHGSEVALEGGATVKLVGDNALKAKAGREMKVTGSGNWDVDLSRANRQTYDGKGATMGEGVKVRLTGVAADEDAEETEEADVWSNVSDLNVQGELELVAGKQVVFTGTNRVGRLTADYTNSADAVNMRQLVLEGNSSTLSITGEGDTDLGHVVLDLRSGTFTQMKGTLTVGGLRSNLHSEGVLEVQNLAITADDTWDIFDVGGTGGQRGYSGNLHVAGNFTMNGKVWEEGNGGDTGTEGDAVDPGNTGGDEGDVGGDLGDTEGGGGNVVGEDDYVQHLDGEVTVDGTAMVQSGVLDVGGKTFTVGGQLGVSGGQFKWHGGEMEVGSLNITGDGAVELAAGEVTVNGGISGDGGTLDISGAPIEGSTGDEVEAVQVTLRGEESASYAGEVKLGKGGTLAVESTGQVLQHVTAVGGDLRVGERKDLTVRVLSGTAPNPGLRNVTLGAGANWTVQGGSFTLAGTLTWGTDASITLECPDSGDAPNILLGGGFSVDGSMTSDSKLTFNLSAEYLKTLDAVESDGRMRAHFLDNDRDGSSGWKRYMQYFEVLASDDPWNYAGLALDEDGYLTWTVKEGATWYEAADGVSGVWSDTPLTSDTSKGTWVDVQNPDRRVSSLEDKNVYLTKENIGADGQAALNVEGIVHPSNVYVESGAYTLTGNEGGIDLRVSGMLVVGEGAVLNLNLKNTSLPMVIVEGKLGLGHAEALPEKTELRLNKEGTLSYTVAGATQDVSEMVSPESKSAALHIEVSSKVGSEGVVWGAAATSPNNGLKLALDGGTVKSGDGNFTLRWADDAATHAGKQKVEAGSLTLEAGGRSVLSGEAVVSDGALLVLGATDAMTYAGTVAGGGTLEVTEGAVTLGGNNTVSKITLTGGTTILGSDGGLGDGNTVLTLTGGNIQAGKGSKVNAGSVEVALGKGASIVAGSVEITGKVTGRGTLRVDGTAKGTLSGDISGFTGTLDTGTSTWTLSRTAGEVHARVMGKGKLVANSKEEITLTGELGAVGDEVTLQNDGSGDLVIATGSVGSGTKLQTSETGDIVLGNAGTHIEPGKGDASWQFGAVTGEGSVVLANVTLPNAGVFGGLSGGKLVVRTAPVAAGSQQGGRVDVAGMDASKLSGITVNEHGLLTGATGDYVVGKDKGLELHFTDGYWAAGTDTSALKHLIGKELSAGGAPQTVATESAEGSLSIHQGDGKDEGLQLAFDASILAGLYAAKQEDVITFCVRALDGGTATWDKTDGTAVYNALRHADDQIANVLAMAWKGSEQDGFTQDGMVLTVVLNDLYLVMKDGGDRHESTSPVDLLGKKATVVLDGQKLTLNWAEDGTVSNLVGTEGAQLEINNTAKNLTADRLRVTFDNTFYSPVTDDRAPGEYTTKAEGQDTEFYGTITGGRGVDITKSGLGTLTVGGNYTLEDGTTRLEGGSLVLSGEENTMKALEFAYQGKAAGQDEVNNNNAEERGLVLNGGHTVLGTISDEGSYADGPRVVLQNGAELSLSGESTLSHTDFTGGEGSGTIILEGTETTGGALALTGDASIKNVAVELNGEGTVLDVGGGNNSLTALSGNGVLRGAAGGNLTISGGNGETFTGTLDTTPGSEVGGTLTVQKGASFTLKNASSTATDTAHGWNVDVQQGGSLTLDLTGKTVNAPLVFGNVSVAGDMTMQLDANIGGAPVKGNLTITDTSTFTVYGTGRHGGTFSLGFSMAEGDLDKFRDRLTLDGAAFLADVVDDVKIGDDGTIWITTRLADGNRFAVPGAHGNAQAGSSILWGALRDPNSPLHGMLENPTSGFALMVLDIYSRVNTEGGDTRGVDRALAAIAGSSISTLGSAVSQDMHRQLTSIRNRTTTMAAEVTPESYGRLPLWHAWINGETDYHKLDADSFAPGFTLNSWGGTIGVDVDLTPRATVGLAVTAMYGDLKADDAPDTADGSVDSVYVSTFLRATSGAWVHSLVISAGAADISLDRTVSYGGNSYRTSGSTDGYSLGALYEVGYSRIMNKRGTVAVQPVVNVEIRHVGIDGYTETGSDGALKVDDIDQTVVTFGAGARMQAAMGTNAFNRTAVFESRLLVKVDAGDRSGTATTGLKGSNGSAEVESAEVGAYGVEAGAGISVPLGRNYGSLFLDGSVEFRDGWTSANATLGYRINF